MQANKKIKELEDLAEILTGRNGKKVVHCHGVFDLMHIGHIRHFEEAKKLGDILTVTITPDQYVNKGPHRPVFDQSLRAEAIAALECVDYVAVNHWPMAVEAIRLLRPDIYVKGSEYKESAKDHTGGIILEEKAVESVGGKLAFTDDITFSSSNLINRHLSIFPKDVRDYLANFAGKYPADNVLSYLQKSQSLKVLVIGETIIDEYYYCQTLGKSGKEPILAAQYMHQEKFAGGILAVANHTVAFSDNVSLLTFLGKHNSQEKFIRENLNDNIDVRFLYMENAPTIIKRRFVEHYPFQKLFELYIMDEGEGTAKRSQMLCAELEKLLPMYDLVIVTDYGHGMISPKAVDILCEKARFLAVNTQVNAGNHGFNTISKYSRADYICISEKELRLEARNERGNLRNIVLDVTNRLSCSQITITRGKQGALCYSQAEGFVEVPAFALSTVDRVGAGDAVFAITSLCAVQQAPLEIMGFIGNAAGAEAVGIVGNKKFIERTPLFKYVISLLK